MHPCVQEPHAGPAGTAAYSPNHQVPPRREKAHGTNTQEVIYATPSTSSRRCWPVTSSPTRCSDSTPPHHTAVVVTQGEEQQHQAGEETLLKSAASTSRRVPTATSNNKPQNVMRQLTDNSRTRQARHKGTGETRPQRMVGKYNRSASTPRQRVSRHTTESTDGVSEQR